MDQIEIRWAEKDEWAPAMTMVWKTFLQFEAAEYGEKGTREFFEFITDDRLHESFERGLYQMMVAKDRDKIVGVATIRNIHHLSLLFVDAGYHKKGVGKSLMNRLCAYLDKEVGENLITVKAAPPAKGFYEKLDFISTGPIEYYGGICVYPMEKYFHDMKG